MSILNRANNRTNAVINAHKTAASIIAAAVVITVTAVSAAVISHSAAMAEAAYEASTVSIERVSATQQDLGIVVSPGTTAIQGQQLQPAASIAYDDQASASSLQPSNNSMQLTAASPQNAASL